MGATYVLDQRVLEPITAAEMAAAWQVVKTVARSLAIDVAPRAAGTALGTFALLAAPTPLGDTAPFPYKSYYDIPKTIPAKTQPTYKFKSGTTGRILPDDLPKISQDWLRSNPYRPLQGDSPLTYPGPTLAPPLPASPSAVWPEQLEALKNLMRHMGPLINVEPTGVPTGGPTGEPTGEPTGGPNGGPPTFLKWILKYAGVPTFLGKTGYYVVTQPKNESYVGINTDDIIPLDGGPYSYADNASEILKRSEAHTNFNLRKSMVNNIVPAVVDVSRLAASAISKNAANSALGWLGNAGLWIAKAGAGIGKSVTAGSVLADITGNYIDNLQEPNNIFKVALTENDRQSFLIPNDKGWSLSNTTLTTVGDRLIAILPNGQWGLVSKGYAANGLKRVPSNSDSAIDGYDYIGQRPDGKWTTLNISENLRKSPNLNVWFGDLTKSEISTIFDENLAAPTDSTAVPTASTNVPPKTSPPSRPQSSNQPPSNPTVNSPTSTSSAGNPPATDTIKKRFNVNTKE